MGYYYNKLVESAVQDPNNTGNDLEQIEKDIMDAPSDGVDEVIYNSPMEEINMSLYESEVMYNDLMRKLGVAELNEYARGKELVLEAVDIKAFFANIIKWIKDRWADIVNFFRKFITKKKEESKIDKEFIDKNKDTIIKNFNMGYWSFTGYNIDYAKLMKNINGFDLDNISFPSGEVPENRIFAKLNAITSLEDEQKKEYGIDTKVQIARSTCKFGAKDIIDCLGNTSNAISNLNKYLDSINKIYKNTISTIETIAAEEERKRKQNNPDSQEQTQDEKANKSQIEYIKLSLQETNIKVKVAIAAYNLCTTQFRKFATQLSKDSAEYKFESSKLYNSFNNVRF